MSLRSLKLCADIALIVGAIGLLVSLLLIHQADTSTITVINLLTISANLASVRWNRAATKIIKRSL